MLYLGILNFSNQILCIIPKNMEIYVEIANTFGDRLLEETNKILGNIKKVRKLERLRDEYLDYNNKNLPLEKVYFCLRGLKSEENFYFVKNQFQNFKISDMSLEEKKLLLEEFFFAQTQNPSFHDLELFIKQFHQLIHNVDFANHPYSIYMLKKLM
jgi:hypothetical protein